MLRMSQAPPRPQKQMLHTVYNVYFVRLYFIRRTCVWSAARALQLVIRFMCLSAFLHSFRLPPQSPQKPRDVASVEDEEEETCTICLEQWTSAGDHRLSALRCGHLFGYRCISKWLKGQTRKCPQCNKKAKHSDIVVLYARTLRALDTSEQERMKSDLLNEQMLRKKAELESAQCRLQLQVLIDKCTKLNNRVQDLEKFVVRHQNPAVQQYSGSQALCGSCLPSSQSQHKYNSEKIFTISQTGNCRIMAYCDGLSCLVVSQPSPQSSFLPGKQLRTLALWLSLDYLVLVPFLRILDSVVVKDW